MRALLYRGGQCIGEVEVTLEGDLWRLTEGSSADRVEIPITDWPSDKQGEFCLVKNEGPLTTRDLTCSIGYVASRKLLKGCHRQQHGRTGKGERKRNRKDRWR